VSVRVASTGLWLMSVQLLFRATRGADPSETKLDTFWVRTKELLMGDKPMMQRRLMLMVFLF
jgi:hypothetical protein